MFMETCKAFVQNVCIACRFCGVIVQVRNAHDISGCALDTVS
jgi:hypothetical protein